MRLGMQVTFTGMQGSIIRSFGIPVKLEFEIPALSSFMKMAACTGIRYVEAVNAYTLTKDLAEDRNLKAYYDVDRQLLQHYS